VKLSIRRYPMSKKLKIIGVLFAVPLAVCFLFATLSFAQEMPKPGETIDKSNIRKYAHLFPEEMIAGFESGWGGLMPPLSIQISETKSAPLTKKYMDFSEKNRGKYTFDAAGKVIGGWDVQGMPFPGLTQGDKDFAAKFVWKGRYGVTVGDNQVSDLYLQIRRKGEPIRTTYQNGSQFAYINRLWMDPKPMIKTTDKLGSAMLLWTLDPPIQRNFQMLALSYIEPTKYGEIYIYLPQMRRVLRADTSQTSTPMSGSINATDDFGGFSGKPYQFTYKLLGEKRVIANMQGAAVSATAMNRRYKANTSEIPFSGETWELRDSYIIEIKSKDSNYPQSKKVVYIDKENLSPLYAMAWDRAGKLWKVWAMYHALDKVGNTNDYILTGNGQLGVELQFGIATMFAQDRKYLTPNLTEKDFTPQSMLKRAQ
jgi:hypothetical protein